MSSAIQYNPNPPRVWSRVQNQCSLIAYKNDDSASNSNFAKAEYEKQMLLKGNILQYKKNSSNLTKKQRYTQISKGMWTNRTKTWATQSDTYTNPNMTSLLRVNYTILDPSNNTFSNPPNPFGCPTTVIQDGGNLVCNVVVDPCTQEVIKRTKSQQLCNPTTDSDVPGKIQPLCWNDGTQTWYPRQRYIMPTSGTKWPQGYKGFTSALTFVGPILSLGFIECGDLDIPLSWTFLNSTCAPITSFNIYQNELLILSVPVTQTSITITGNLPGTYTYYVTSVSNTFESEKSNIVIINTEHNYNINDISVSGAIISNNGKTITFLTNGSITFVCSNISISVTCVGGGGGGGGGAYLNGGGGGAGGGGQISVTTFLSSITTYSVIIGNGGTFGIAGSSSSNGGNGGNGGSSSITGIITSNGGNGGNGGVNTTSGPGGPGGNGGNAGGGGTGGTGGTTNNTGGTGINGGGGGGGGYSGSSGGTGSTNGVDGYGSGGGGGGGNSGSGGIGGTNAGNGSQGDSNAASGIPNKGGGGGGGKSGNGNVNATWSGGNGGSGVVILNIL